MSTGSGLVKGLTPTHSILSPSDNSKVLNFINLNTLGTNTKSNLMAFRNSQLSSKFNSSNLFEPTTDYSITYAKLSDNYINNILTQNSFSCGITRQHNYSSLNATLNNTYNTLDSKSVTKLLNYNSNLNVKKDNDLNINNLKDISTNTNNTPIKPNQLLLDLRTANPAREITDDTP
jgi:hypothetical protein